MCPISNSFSRDIIALSAISLPPFPVLASLRNTDRDFAENFHLVLCGKTDKEILDSIERSGLSANVENLGYLEHTKVVELMQAASVLLLPLRKEPEYKAVLPGKLFEYLAARRPILGIGQPDGAMARIVADTNTGETADWNDKAAMKAFVDRHWEAFRQGRTLYDGRDVSAYSRRSLTRRMAELMNRIAK